PMAGDSTAASRQQSALSRRRSACGCLQDGGRWIPRRWKLTARSVTGSKPGCPGGITQGRAVASHTCGMDPEIRRLFLETVEALEAVLVTMQLEEGNRDPKELEYARTEVLRRVVELRRAIESSTNE